MPVLSIGDGAGGTGICDPYAVLAAMAFPRDALKQRQFIGRAIESAIGQAEGRALAGELPKLAGISADRLGPAFGALLGKWLVPQGGLSTLADAPGFARAVEEMAGKKWASSVAGDMLHWIVDLHLHGYRASVRKAVAIAKVFYGDVTTIDGRNLGASQRYIETNWEHFKPSAHLLAAYRLWERSGGASSPQSTWFSPFSAESLPAFLAYAHWYLETAAKIVPHGQRVPVLDVAAAWQPPALYPLNRSVRLRVGPLPEWMLALAGEPAKSTGAQ